MPAERCFARLALPVRPGDRVTLADGTSARVETVKLADDLRDAKGVVIVDDGDAAAAGCGASEDA
jgi:hypothetical protein